MNSQQQTIYSKACGKVLICGGYGVLQEQNIGLSIALQNHFYCKLEKISSTNNASSQVVVSSPQIKKSYKYVFNQNTGRLQQANHLQNIFVENAIVFTLNHFNQAKTIGKIHLTLIFDKGFISQKYQQQNQHKEKESIFCNYKEGYSKTGLGSSACVVVSIVSALCSHLGHQYNKELINGISQVANLSAQKKIGSNFDISTAVFGTHLYRNILPHKAYDFINKKDLHELLKIDPQVKSISESQVNQIILQNSVSYMIDVQRGADTRLMVSGFMKNLKTKQQSVQKSFFQESKQITQKLYKILMDEKSVGDKKQLKRKLNEVNLQQRNLQQKYSKITQTPIQPQQFNSLLNQIMQDQNVLYVVCPGSGGFDALFLLGLKAGEQSASSFEYYDKLIERVQKKYSKSLGLDVNLILNPVNVKWIGDNTVSKREISEIQTFLKEQNTPTTAI